MPADIKIGTTISKNLIAPGLEIHSDDVRLSGHIDTPWMRTYIHRAVGHRPVKSDTRQADACIREIDRSKSLLVTGGSGSGKTMVSELIIEHELYQGTSMVILDPKPERIARAIHYARKAGLHPKDVIVIAPWLGRVPGYNALQPPGFEIEIAAAFTSTVLEQSLGAGGARMKNMLMSSLTFVGGCGLNLLALQRLLLDEQYRSRLLAKHKRPMQGVVCDVQAFSQARDFFLNEFSQWAKGSRSEAIAPVLNRIRSLTRSSFLSAVLASPESTLDFASLWKEQRVIIIYSNQADLGQGAQILCGLATSLLLRTSFRTSGRPVMLVADEMGVLEAMCGGAMAEIASTSRSRGLKLLICTQFLEQLSDELTSSVLTNASTQIHFRATTDARLMAASLSVGSEPMVTSVTIDAQADKLMPGGVAITSIAFEIRDEHGEVLELSPQAFRVLEDETSVSGDPIAAIRLFAAQSERSQLFIIDPSTEEPIQLESFLASVPKGLYYFSGPKPLCVVVMFPRPKISNIVKRSPNEITQAWTRQLLDLPVATAVLKSAGLPPQIVAIDHVADPVFGEEHKRFVEACMAINGRPWRDLITTAEDIEFDDDDYSALMGSEKEDLDDQSIA